MKILCICPIGIGNYLLMYPACAALKKKLPESELHLLALRGAIRELAADDPLWKGMHLIDPTRNPSLIMQAAFVRRLWRERYDLSLAFFPSNTWQYNLLPYISGVKVRHAFGYPLKQGSSLSFLNTRHIQINPDVHDINQNFRLVSACVGERVGGEPVEFPSLWGASERSEADALLHSYGAPARFIGIHPGSSGEHGMASKRWDPMRFGHLAERICAELGAQALVFGGKDEEKIKHVTASVLREPCHIIEPCHLRKTAALLSRCTLLLCNDSGLMHMAAGIGTPVAAIFGPTDEKRNGPWGERHLVIRKPMAGFPLWTAATAGDRASSSGVDPAASLRALSVDDAWDMLGPWLARLEIQARTAGR
jgi:ADP-heptose:LPS heptosyltransferase